MNEQGNFTYSYLENGQHYIKTFNKEGTLLNKYGPYKDLFSNVNLENQLILMYYKTSEKGLLKIDENGNLDTLSVDQYIENSIEPHNFFILAKNFIGYQVNGDLYSYYRLNDDGTIRNQFRNVAPIYNAIIDDEYTYLYNTKLEKYDSNSDLVYSVQIDKAVNKIYLLKNDYMAVLNFGNELLILNEKGEEIERMSINPIGMEFNDHSSVFYYLDNEVLKEFILNLK